MIKKITYSSIGFLFLIGNLMAQTVNTGELVVSNSTIISTVADFNNTKTGSLINNGEILAYSNWNNDGVVDHDNNGITKFLGVNEQIISGVSTNYFYNVLFDVSPTAQNIELSGSLSIANESFFDNGIIDNTNFGDSFVFEQSAFHSNTSNDSFVNGNVIKIGDESFKFPIGDEGFYRYAEISSPSENGDVFSGQFFFENPDNNFPLANKEENITLIDNQEYWVISRNSGSSNVILTISWDEDSTTPFPIIDDPQEAIHIVWWDENEQLWKDMGGIVDDLNKTVTTPLFIQNYGVFTLARVTDIIVEDDIIIYNGVTPNNDGVNDYFQIVNIQNFPNNNVKIFNRWGAKVFETRNYDTVDNVFVGRSEGKLTVGNGLLPTATYYYIITYDTITSDGSIQRKNEAGFLYLDTGK